MPGMTEQERFERWEAKLTFEWGLPLPFPDWRDLAQERDLAGKNKYPVFFGPIPKPANDEQSSNPRKRPRRIREYPTA
ncbi:MAG: hypothetical protein ACO3N3_09135 [bacterium]